MRAAIVAIVVGLAFVASAGPRKTLVLPLDGNAPAAQKTGLNATVAKLAKAGSVGTVTVGDATFNDTAAAVGCKAQDASCAEKVRATLAVDELVYGTATTNAGTTSLVVYRVSKGSPPKSQAGAVPETDTGAQAEVALQPLFPMASSGIGDAGSAAGSGSDVALGSGSDQGSGSAVAPPGRRSFFDTRDRKIGVAFAGVGLASILVGLSMWAGKNGIQDDIDNHPTMTLDDFHDLEALEDRAASKALWGNILVGAGVALGAVGAFYLWKDQRNRGEATVTPAPVEGGGAVVLRGRW